MRENTQAAIAQIMNLMTLMTPEQRERCIDHITDKWCPDCGRVKPCNCE